MSDAIERFGRYMAAERRCSPATVDIYTRDLRGFEAYLKAAADSSSAAGFDPAAVTLADVRGWVMREVEAGTAVGSVNRKISTLRSFFRYLMREGIVASNPVREIKALRGGRRLPVFVEQSRMTQLVRVLEEPSEEFPIERDAAVILLLYGCGLRRSELASLTLGSIDLRAGTVRVMGKGAKERIVPILPEVATRLEHYLLLRAKEKICESAENCLFLTNKGRGLSAQGVYGIVRSYLAAAGVQGKRSPHVLRHTFATHLMQHGASVRVVQQLLGHASLAATQIYTHNTIESLKKTYSQAHPRAMSNIQKTKEDKV
ncbi:tyrosine-type recombinase/integrase [uncultured Rikenella sp.]|uniref:tyrosine-type recombinase/integrase n=1 Tax=uncultured Rikenella sp. TaxID=368003 RepID=UPI002729C12F|nr:tyrosine-type recombinase/integrase [uncultured Rikenella sp.]